MAYRLYYEPVFLSASDNLSRDRFDSIMNVLRQNGVDIQAQVSRATPRKPFFRVAVRPFSPEEISYLRSTLLGPAAELNSEYPLPTETDAVSFVAGYEEMVATSLGYLSYYNRGLFASPETDITEELARELADQFVVQRLGGPQDFVFDTITHLDRMGYRVEYVQVHEEIPIYPAHIMVLVRPGGVAGAWMCRLRVVSTDGTEKTTRSAAEALLSMLSHRLTVGETGSVVVHSIELGYYSRIYDTLDPWSAAPVWRIRTDRGDYFINAHSGIVEE